MRRSEAKREEHTLLEYTLAQVIQTLSWAGREGLQLLHERTHGCRHLGWSVLDSVLMEKSSWCCKADGSWWREEVLGKQKGTQAGGHERRAYIHWHHLTECGVGSQSGLGTEWKVTSMDPGRPLYGGKPMVAMRHITSVLSTEFQDPCVPWWPRWSRIDGVVMIQVNCVPWVVIPTSKYRLLCLQNCKHRRDSMVGLLKAIISALPIDSGKCQSIIIGRH